MEFSPVGDKLYCTYWDDSLSVFDCAADTLRKRVGLGGSMSELQYHQPANKLYCTRDEWYEEQDSLVRVIDCVQDEPVATIRVPGPAGDLCTNPVENKVYCSVWDDYPGACIVAVIDPRADTLVARVAVLPRPDRLCYNRGNNRVYVTHAYSESLSVIDCTTDSLLHYIRLPRGVYHGVCSPVSNKLYLTADDELVVVDCGADTVCGVIAIGSYSAGWTAYDSDCGRLYVVGGSPRAVFVVDCAADSVVEIVPTQTWSGYAVWNGINRRLYCSTWEEGRIAVLHDPVGVADDRTGRAQATKAVPSVVRRVLYLAAAGESGTQSALFDLSGRKATDLRPGPNDISHIAPGVYFVREAGEPSDGTCEDAEPRGPGSQGSSVRKVIVQR